MSIEVNLKNVTISYERHPALHHISGTFAAGSLTAIAGINGAGKSTLLKGIAGIIKADSGQIEIVGDRQKIAYLPQVAEIQRDFPISVLHLITTGYWQKVGSVGKITSQMRDDSLRALESVGMSGFENRDIASLSLGQFQRTLFARLLIQDASLILLDEPFASIDSDTTANLIEIILRLNRENRTIICVLHNLEQIKKYFPNCLLLARKCVAWGQSEISLSAEKLIGASFLQEINTDSHKICHQEL